jgi:hypothetical protein
MAMQFLLHKRIAMSVGLLPFSSVGYNFSNIGVSDGLSYGESFVGTGGISQLYAGLSFDIWRKRLSVGANVNYLFGTINHQSSTTYGTINSTPVYNIKTLKIYDMDFDFGLQYIQPFSKSDRLVLGLTYSPKNNLSNQNIQIIQNVRIDQTAETVSDTIKGKSFELPAGYGLGFTYVRDDKFIIAADVLYQEWSKIKFNGDEGSFNNRMKIAAGLEYIPNLYSRPFYNRMRYRAGLNYANSYVKINGQGYREVGASLGIGIPVSDNRSYINFSIEYTKVLPDAKFMIKEDYARITLSYTFNEFWFFKNKLQ